VRTNIDIDDDLMAQAMLAGPFKTKKDAVEAGLKLLARQAAYREILKWRGKLKWEGDESIDWTKPAADASAGIRYAAEPPLPLQPSGRAPAGAATATAPAKAPQPGKRRARR
jgi:Arc/MetJ family transcription regulator